MKFGKLLGIALGSLIIGNVLNAENINPTSIGFFFERWSSGEGNFLRIEAIKIDGTDFNLKAELVTDDSNPAKQGEFYYPYARLTIDGTKVFLSLEQESAQYRGQKILIGEIKPDHKEIFQRTKTDPAGPKKILLLLSSINPDLKFEIIKKPGIAFPVVPWNKFSNQYRKVRYQYQTLIIRNSGGYSLKYIQRMPQVMYVRLEGFHDFREGFDEAPIMKAQSVKMSRSLGKVCAEVLQNLRQLPAKLGIK